MATTALHTLSSSPHVSLCLSLSPSKHTGTADQTPTAAVVVRQIETMTGQPKGTSRQWQALLDTNNRPNWPHREHILNLFSPDTKPIPVLSFFPNLKSVYLLELKLFLYKVNIRPGIVVALKTDSAYWIVTSLSNNAFVGRNSTIEANSFSCQLPKETTMLIIIQLTIFTQTIKSMQEGTEGFHGCVSKSLKGNCTNFYILKGKNKVKQRCGVSSIPL